MYGFRPMGPNQGYIAHIFSLVDRNRSGRISVDELRMALSNGTWAPFNMETTLMMIAMFDVNYDWHLNFMEFQQLWNYLLMWQQSFAMYDRNRSGTISFGELYNALYSSGYRLSARFCQYLMMKMDRTKRGHLLFDDYVRLCITLQILTNGFRAKDIAHTGFIQVGYEEFLMMALMPRVYRILSSIAMTISYSGNFINLLRRWKGSVWKAVWKELLAFLILYYTVRIVIMLACGEDPQRMDKAKRLVTVVDSFTTKIPLHFLLGFYVGQVVTRWWAQVQAVPWPDEVMVWTNTFFYKDDPTTKSKRRTVARYLILCETLVLRNVSTRIRKRFPNLESLQQANLITQEELDLYNKAVVENTRWQLPLQWIINGIVVPAINNNEIPGSGAGTMIGKVNDFRNALRSIFMYDWVCIPLVYTQTCSVVVYGYFAFCLVGHQFFHQQADLYFPYLTVLQFIFFVVRPFGEDDDDVELNVVLDRHAAVAMNMADQIASLVPHFSWDDEKKEDENEDKDKGGAEPKSVVRPGGPDEEKDEDADGVLPIVDDKPPFLILPYSRASLRKPKDHFPKLHANVVFKGLEEQKLITAATNPFIVVRPDEEGGDHKKKTPYNKHTKKQFCHERNMF